MILDDATRRTLSKYLADVRQLNNEKAKTHRFAALISELFPGSSAPTDFAAGIEKLVRVDVSAGNTKRGFVDAYYGNAVIEFENSLQATESHALDQLREYTSGIWNAEGQERRPLICVLSDGVNWKTYRPTPKSKGRSTPDNVALQELRALTLTESTLADFWLWLTSLLFRPARTEPTAERFRVDFGATSPAFADATEALDQAWGAVGQSSECRLAFDTWQRYLTFTYGQLADQESEDLLRLFLKHTYLASLARLLIWASLSKGKTNLTLRDTAKEILSGQFFEEQRIENLVEDDFFQWVRRAKAEAILGPVWERTLSQLETYDLAHLSQDVLKGVYQELVDPKDRRELGEYYTPDWLCERIVGELLPKGRFVSVLDPSCGSGSFLRAAIAHQLAANPEGTDGARLRQILENVIGIDIHPLAVIISRATYLLAIRSVVKASKRPIQIPVYLADSLFLPAEVKQLALGQIPGFEIRFGDRKVSIPEDLVKRPELFDPAINAAAGIAIDHAKSRKENRKTLASYIRKVVPQLDEYQDVEAMLDALWEFTHELSDLINKEQNSIWAFIVRNSYRPAMLRDRFDFILGNPPWLSYRNIANPEYQAEIKKRAVDDYEIAPRHQKLFTQMELATIFLAHTLSTFAHVGAHLGFVMPLSVLVADQHENLRSRKYKAPICITSYWDLRAVRPVFNVPSCVLFAVREDKPPEQTESSYSLPAVEWAGKLPMRDVTWHEAQPLLSANEATARLIYLGDRNALSTSEGRTSPNKPSPYEKSFHQGATILPRSFYFVTAPDMSEAIDPDRLYSVRTDPEQAEDAKEPYDKVKMQGRIEGRFLFSTALSRHLVPFALHSTPPIVLPCTLKDGSLSVVTAEDLRETGHREFAEWMRDAESIWNKERKRKAEKQTLYERLDYQSELTRQNLQTRYLVLYNAAGTNISATVLDRQTLPLPFVVEHKLYWAAFDELDEAHYLAAFLNSNMVNDEIKPFQSLGLMGERDIEKKVLELPIPFFDEKNSAHQQLVKISTEAHTRAAAFVAATDLPDSLAKRRGMVRTDVSKSIDEIDAIVAKLLS